MEKKCYGSIKYENQKLEKQKNVASYHNLVYNSNMDSTYYKNLHQFVQQIIFTQSPYEQTTIIHFNPFSFPLIFLFLFFLIFSLKLLSTKNPLISNLPPSNTNIQHLVGHSRSSDVVKKHQHTQPPTSLISNSFREIWFSNASQTR